MYPPITTKPGARTVSDALDEFAVDAASPGLGLAPDGLTLVSPDPADGPAADIWARWPERLRTFLVDLRLLRGIPLAYLVPDEALLPPESVRFFEVDPTWCDRIVDGVLVAANIGTLELTYTASLVGLVRDHVDDRISALAEASVPDTGWTPAAPITGMLIRSQAVRRWPDMTVTAASGHETPTADRAPMAILRREALSSDIYIALFAGRPTLVEISEPPVGARYGVEPATGEESFQSSFTFPFAVDGRNADGTDWAGKDWNGQPWNPQNWENDRWDGTNWDAKLPVFWRDVGRRTLNINALAQDIMLVVAAPASSATVALHLEQRPFVQQFLSSVPESSGSRPLPPGSHLPLSKARTMNVAHLHARASELDAMGTA